MRKEAPLGGYMDDPFDTICAHIEALTARPAPEGVLAGALARISPEGDERAAIFGRATPGGPPVEDAGVRVRVASISKAATARAVVETVLAGWLSLDEPLVEVIGWDDAPAQVRKVRIRHLLSHLSGLTDHGGYIVDPPGSVTAFIEATPTALSGDAPGMFFRYANLNYVLLGQVLEVVRGERFDSILRRLVLEPAGIAGGFNWAGVDERKRRLPLYQWTGGRLVLQVDGPEAEWDADLIWRDGAGQSLEDWRPGVQTSWFSPHAGLRMSVSEAARLARLIGRDDAAGRMQREVQWAHDGKNGEDGDGLFQRFALGLSVYEGHPRIPGKLVGHAGHALGFSGGAWFDQGSGTAWAYFLLGMPDLTEGQDEEAFYAEDELFILRQF
ncbi:serine hydrolase domain-containing protein [Aestuariibius sp. 2305UL40-4]|uniref:serine hydrolase domain-containing protein n=1 Tax=Aestuariibius violaceus TaxID=3234132 RepID=UPI00345EB048